ncbi:MAG: peptidoglycan hydrolase CwlO-like protein [Granulosicoccus sp.]|jgi:peptidoglycan hydrolase CwlO-like protein
MEEKENSTNNRIFLILAVILLVLSGILGWQLFEQKAENDRKAEEIKQLGIEKDNLTAELDELLEQYNGLEEERGELTEELAAQQAEVKRLMQEVEKYRGDAEKLSWYRGQLAAFKTKYASLEAKYDSLAVVTDSLFGATKNLEGNLTQEKSLNQNLTKENMQLVNKVALGSMLTAYKISVEGIRGKKDKITTKAKRVEKMRICYTLSENAIAKPGSKTIYLRIVDPEGKVLTKDRGEEFEFEGGSMTYSLSEDITYENKQMDMCLFNALESENFAVGKYTVEIYTDKMLIGTASLSLR